MIIMKKVLFLCLLATFQVVLKAQSTQVKNVIAFETGIYNKGLTGLSYSRILRPDKFVKFSFEFAGGGCQRLNDVNRYASAGLHLLLDGGEKFSVSMGADIKYHHITLIDDYYMDFLTIERITQTYEGMGLAPAIGFCYQAHSGFYFRMRSMVNWFTDSTNQTRIRPGLGISLGGAF